jgi:hypothetical protein
MSADLFMRVIADVTQEGSFFDSISAFAVSIDQLYLVYHYYQAEMAIARAALHIWIFYSPPIGSINGLNRSLVRRGEFHLTRASDFSSKLSMSKIHTINMSNIVEDGEY